jgi:uncharacterized membrane protein
MHLNIKICLTSQNAMGLIAHLKKLVTATRQSQAIGKAIFQFRLLRMENVKCTGAI